ncbi:hypothetical protein DFQ28_000650 [Apophysomyces sp. BC1034]|nr:hypothetical protein DFQ29_003763 [Apophysomyces sp. BC1021]KAG0191255.1 hypothetical protein DFQ28_000650 [Apophysomyces sp. BC1034]
MAYELIPENSSQDGTTKGINIHGWTITSKKSSICNSTEMNSLHQAFGIPPPEMVFGNNHVTIKKGGTELTFNAKNALALVDTSSNSSEHIKVAYADEWTRKSTANHTDVKDVIKPYDWTYSTVYNGTLVGGPSFEAADAPAIDIQRLKTPEPILFYDETVLYEDELADNGTAMLSIRLSRRCLIPDQ